MLIRALLVSIVIATGERHGDRGTTRADTPDARALCPALSGEPSASAGGVAPSVGGEDVSTDLEGLVRALPASAHAWTRTSLGTMARGAAGHWSPVVNARYESNGAAVLVQVTDLVHVCTCEAGMGRRLRDARDARAFEIAGHPASDDGRALTMWINDRCSLQVHGAATIASMMHIVEAVDLVALGAACPVRR